MRNILLLFVLAHCLTVSAQKEVSITVCPDKTENRVSDKLYGFLLEHIYHSVSNGVWGEDVWNRSFEETLTTGNWNVDSNGLVTLNASDDSASCFNIGKGKDFELDLDVCLSSGNGSVSIGVRDQSRDGMQTNSIVWTLGKRFVTNTGWVWYRPKSMVNVETLTKGNLHKGKLTHVKIKCEGDTIEGYEDNEPVFRRVIKECPRDGFITIGGSHCDALFKDISLKSIGGSDGYIDLNPIRHWRLTGDGSISAAYDDPLNDKAYVELSSHGRLVGIEQHDKYVVVGNDPLKGSLWLKGDVNSVTVCLTEGDKVLARQNIKGINSRWQKFPIELDAEANVGDTLSDKASIKIYTTERGVLDIDQVSLMHKTSINNGGFRPSLTKAVADAHPSILRWPGGSFSEQYHFEDGIGKQEERKGKLRWDDFDPLSFGTDEFIAFCHKVGAEPQIVVPIGYHNYRGYDPGTTDWLQRALDWMDYCNGDSCTEWGRRRIRNGHKEPYNVRYWEIDNEVWKMDVHQYADIVRTFSTAMRKRYPDIKIIACGCGRLGKEGVGLDSTIIHDVAECVDYISPHYYQTIDKFGNDGVEEYSRYLDKLASWIAASKNPRMKIYVSEWNLDGIDMRTGLFAGGFLNSMERMPSVEMAAVALVLRHTSAPGWNNALVNFDQQGWFAAPNYIVFKLWRDHYLPNRIAMRGDSGKLNITATMSDDKAIVCLKIVNPTSETVWLNVNGVPVNGRAKYETVYAPKLTSHNSMAQPDNVTVETGELKKDKNSFILQVCPYSASVLTIKH